MNINQKLGLAFSSIFICIVSMGLVLWWALGELIWLQNRLAFSYDHIVVVKDLEIQFSKLAREVINPGANAKKGAQENFRKHQKNVSRNFADWEYLAKEEHKFLKGKEFVFEAKGFEHLFKLKKHYETLKPYLAQLRKMRSEAGREEDIKSRSAFIIAFYKEKIFVLLNLSIERFRAEVSKSLEAANEFSQLVRNVSLGITVATFGLTVFLTLIVGGIVTGPIMKLKEASEKFGKGQYDSRIEIKSKDEIGTLARTFENMAHQISDRTTSLKKVNMKRKQLIAELEAKNVEIEQFAFNVSHDLKSPLITIGGFISLIGKNAPAGKMENIERDIKSINRTIKLMRRQLDDLLQISQIGRVSHPLEDISLVELVKQAVKQVDGQIQARGASVTVSSDLPMVFGDRSRLRDLFQNLVANAVQYMGKQKEPWIDVGCRDDEGETVFYVRDNGIGIFPDDQEKIFGIFERLNPNSEGTGMGLAIVKRIIEIHGGRIWIESEGEGKGSTFCFTLSSNEEPISHEI